MKYLYLCASFTLKIRYVLQLEEHQRYTSTMKITETVNAEGARGVKPIFLIPDVFKTKHQC